ncbi:hypothetical protein [Lewinella sp. IMCC34191]|uniref:hypothetical protein n=1 Tax=Lewinella sp. IMCC34191 TaxID=2259172 RepID=UPI000E23D2A6|nr:hypothetical protein [Lewinella sp. IMCC34191]
MPDAKSVICTVFERDYHHGVGALANSLYAAGFRGELYAGYRGALPPWVGEAAPDASGNLRWEVAPGFHIYFALQKTEELLAYVKPELLRQVWNRYEDRGIENVFYIDCDIVIKAEWRHFEDWVSWGVALCEDMNSPLPVSHPLRKQWQRYYEGFGIDYKPKDDVYVNGGFVGINKKNREFSELWDQIQTYMKQYTGKQDRIGIADRWNMFHFMDQDALNIAKDLTEDVSIMGRDAMDFGRLGYVMSHAAGRRKPWHKNYVRNILLDGSRPSNTDKVYWHYVESPIRVHSSGTVRSKRFALKAASLIGRVFTRSQN